jgi:hypothetical protein
MLSAKKESGDIAHRVRLFMLVLQVSALGTPTFEQDTSGVPLSILEATRVRVACHACRLSVSAVKKFKAVGWRTTIRDVITAAHERRMKWRRAPRRAGIARRAASGRTYDPPAGTTLERDVIVGCGLTL